MTPSLNTKIIAWMAVVLLAGALCALVFYSPIIAAVVFVFLVSILTIGLAKKEGKLKGAVYFLKEILFGW